MPYFFKSARLGFRPWNDSDLLIFAYMLANDQVMEFYPAKKTYEETRTYIQKVSRHFQTHGFGVYAVDRLEDSRFIGYIGFQYFNFDTRFSPGVEIGWRLHPDVWGQGLATEGALACLNYGWSELGFEKVYSFTALINKRSERVMQKVGLSKSGEFDHPLLEKGHALERHVLYEIQRPDQA